MSVADSVCPRCHAPVPQGHTHIPTRKEPREVLDGKWEIEQKLGQGGMGTVYLAKDLELERRVAIKMMAGELANHPEVVARFEREARMMARLDHPNLVPVYAVGRKGTVPFIVMKLLQGQSLGDHLHQHGRFEVSAALALVKQACVGLQFIHEHGVVHRDLKPANIFVAPDGHLTLLDFGVARDTNDSMTRSGMMVGTPRYMAPEQVVGKKVDFRADLYALATVVFEMVTGATVFKADSDFSIMQAHLNEPPPDPLSFGPLPEGVAAVLLRGLAKSPADRHESALAFYAALEAGSKTAVSSRAGADVSNLSPLTATPRPRQASVPTRQAEAPARPSGNTALSDAERAAVAPPRRWPLALGLAAAGAVTLGAVWGLGKTREPDPQPTIVAVVAPEPAKPVEPLPLPPLEEVKPPEPQPAAAADPGAPKPPSPKRPAVAPKPAEDESTPAVVNLVSLAEGEPASAFVDVDGIRKGSTPFKVTLEPGPHQLVFRRQGYQPVTRQITVRAGEIQKLKVELTP